MARVGDGRLIIDVVVFGHHHQDGADFDAQIRISHAVEPSYGGFDDVHMVACSGFKVRLGYPK